MPAGRDEDAGGQPSPGSEALEVVSLVSWMAETCGGGPRRTGFQAEVIEDAERLHAALKESVTDAVAAAIPDIDFGHYVVVAAHAGQQISCGSGLAVTAARELDAEVEVEATIFVPCGQLSGALTWPSVFVRIPRRDKPFVFVEKMAPAPGCK